MNAIGKDNGDRQLALYLTGDHVCSYLHGRQARTLFVDPSAPMDTLTYQSLVDQGFRRSGAHVYRPACRGCAACVPVRVPVPEFAPNRSQRRNWKRNAAEIDLDLAPAAFNARHFGLYLRYLKSRHADGGMAEDLSASSYRRFLIDPWGGETRFLELRQGPDLVAVAVTDVLVHGLSAVYTFFDPERSDRGLGTFAVLAQLDLARRLGLPYLYLGYWIDASRKMSYKDRFRPIEAWDGRAWRRFAPDEPLDLPP
jgi:arginine-tRNA-protein transferase